MRRLGIGFFAARSPCQRARRGCPSIGPLDASEASMALPTALLSDASRRWRGGALDWCFATRGIVGPLKNWSGFSSNWSSFWLASTSCGVLKVVFLNVRAVLRCRELQLCTNFDAFGQLLGGLGSAS